MSYYRKVKRPLREALQALCQATPPDFIQGQLSSTELTDPQILALQDWCSMKANPEWSTGIALMDAADSIVEEALNNGNIEVDNPPRRLPYPELSGVFAVREILQELGRSDTDTDSSVWDDAAWKAKVFTLFAKARTLFRWDCNLKRPSNIAISIAWKAIMGSSDSHLWHKHYPSEMELSITQSILRAALNLAEMVEPED